jgi:hypothetical protein
MKIEAGKFCPLIKKDCVGLQCAFFTQVRGTNPNTGEEVDEWACAIKWIPTLIIESANKQRQTTASVDALRNEVDQTLNNTSKVLLCALQGLPSIEPANVKILP